MTDVVREGGQIIEQGAKAMDRQAVLAKLGREKEAIPELKAAVYAKVDTPAIRKLLAQLESKLGQEGNAPKPPVETNTPPSS